MSKVDCKKCGHTISNGASPSDHQGRLISEISYHKIDESKFETELHSLSVEVFECIDCGALGIESQSPYDDTLKWYYPETKLKDTLMNFITKGFELDEEVL